MKITALIFSLVFLASTACAQSKEVETKYTDYGFAVTLPSDVTLAHEHATDGKDSTGAPTTEDNFTSKDNDYMIVVVGYTKPLVATSKDLVPLVKALARDNKISEISADTQDGQPCASALITVKTDSGALLLVDIMVTIKGNRMFVVNYIRKFDSDFGGVLLFANFKML